MCADEFIDLPVSGKLNGGDERLAFDLVDEQQLVLAEPTHPRACPALFRATEFCEALIGGCPFNTDHAHRPFAEPVSE